MELVLGGEALAWHRGFQHVVVLWSEMTDSDVVGASSWEVHTL